jgi:thiamine-monophosphate kinase
MTLPRAEDSLVAKIVGYSNRQAGGRVRLGIGDDAALWKPRRGFEVILTSDWLLEGSHFLREMHPADSVGWKCVARAASDIAAMGGAPRCFLLNLALPPGLTGKWLGGFLAGVRRAARFLGAELAGGDTTRSQTVAINVTVVGEILEGKAVLRSGARPGDLLFVSGRLGEAELGLLLLRKGGGAKLLKSPAVRKHLYPEPRVALGGWLAGQGLASAMMDLSDGLSSDLPRLCKASGAGAEVGLRWLPVPIGVDPKQALGLALHGGEDYELLFAVPPRKAAAIPKEFRGLKLTRIGRMNAGRRIQMVDKDGASKPLVAGGWDPFRK